MQIIAEKVLPALSHAAGIGIVWSTGGNRQHAGACGRDLILGGSGGGLGGGSCTGEDEDDDEGTNDVFHIRIPLKLYLQKKISLDNQMR